jgi:hydrogenase expression/formation protein HypE
VIVASDTKLADRGSADLAFINTAGAGVVPPAVCIYGANAPPGDVVIVSGAIGAHGLAIMSHREGLAFSFPLTSDCAPLNALVSTMLKADARIHCLRDPTCGGLATALHEFAVQSHVGIETEEVSAPIPESVQAACELRELDPLCAANEGKLVAVVPPEAETHLLAAMQSHPYGEEATVIGRITAAHPGALSYTRPLAPAVSWTCSLGRNCREYADGMDATLCAPARLPDGDACDTIDGAGSFR